MRKLLLFSFVILSCTMAADAQSTLMAKANELKKLHTKINKAVTNDDRQNAEIAFFNAFPGTFSELDNLYGFQHDRPMPLYHEAENHILKGFNKISAVNDTLYYSKIIAIAIGGKWDADAISCFQYGLSKRIFENTELTASLLEKHDDAEIRGFWYFVFDGPHPENKIPSKLVELRRTHKRVYELMLSGHKQVLQESDHHGH